MFAAEFQTKIIDGRIEIPETLRDQFQGDVKVILFAESADPGESAWAGQNRRRWQLIAKKFGPGLTSGEKQELAHLQQCADEQLAQVGAHPLEELERWYAQVSQEG